MTPLEETLGEALSDFGLRELPKEWKPDGKVGMIDGIALVTKIGGIKEYVRVTNNGDNISVSKDYGRCAAIVRIEKYFAVNTIDKSMIPNLQSNEQIIQYLCKSRYDRSDIELLLSKENKSHEQQKADRDEIKRRINELALSYAKRKLAEEKRVRNLKKYKDGNKEEIN